MNVSEMQRKLYAKAIQEKEHQFSNLYNLMTNDAWLEMAYGKVSSNRGSNTAGVDNITKANFEREKKGGMERLKLSLKDGSFRPSPVRRVYIREVKASGREKMRPIGIPTLQDRIVQEAARMILEPIFEPDFSRHSYGFRPGLSTHKAMAYVFKVIQPHTHHNWIIEGDISSYFDTVNHKLMMRFLKRRIKDKRLLDLIWKFLRSGIMEEGVFRNATIGTPQGGIVSPLLSNIYLTELDRYMERYTDTSSWTRKQRPKRGLPNFLYVRYADDFVVLCRGTKVQAEAMKQELSEFLEQELKLTLSWEKTKVTHVTDGFEFLGFQFVGGTGTKGKLTGKVRIPEGALKKAVSKVHILLRGSTEMSTNLKIQALNAVIRGWCQYYQYTSSPQFMFRKLEYKVFWLMAHWLGKKYKLSMPEVMRRYRRGNTFGTAMTTLVLPTTFKSKPMRFKNAPNPYSTESQDLPRYEEVFDLAELWTGIEARAGSGDIREAIFIRDRGICGLCGLDVEWDDVELDHIRPRITFKDPGKADTDSNLWILHRECHRRKTAREQLS